MLSFLFGTSAPEEPPEVKTIELQAAEEAKPLGDVQTSGAFFESVWRGQCLAHALATFVELRAPDVIGSSTLTVSELCEKCACSNEHAMENLCRVLAAHDVVVVEDDRVSLGAHGAYLQRSLVTKYADIVDSIGAPRMLSAWMSLATSISEPSTPIGEVDPVVMNLFCPDWRSTSFDEIKSVAERLELDTNASIKVGVWALEPNVEEIQKFFPNATVYRADGAGTFEADTDLILFHRTLTLFGVPATIRSAAEALKPGGRILVIDCARHSSLALEQMFMNAVRVPEFMDEEEWVQLLSDDFSISSVRTIREGLIVIDATRSERGERI